MIWTFAAELIVFAVFGIALVVYGSVVLQMRNTREAGILTIIVLSLPRRLGFG